MAKKLNVTAIVLLSLVGVGFILALVGMFTAMITSNGTSVGLFHEMWDALKKAAEIAAQLGGETPSVLISRTIAIVAFIVTLVCGAALLANCVLGLLGKNIKALGITAGVIAILGGLGVLIGGAAMASDLEVSMGIGVYLGTIGGLLMGIVGIVAAAKNKKA